MLHESLWHANSDLARACLEHPFVQGLRDGSLDPTVFRGYIAQDAFFLGTFARAYALAFARTGEPEFHELIGGVIEELKLHGGYGVAAADPNRACRAYTDFLLHTAWHCEAGEIVAAMTPCMRLYAWLGAELSPASAGNHPYRRWIETYSSAGFHTLAARLERLLDRLAADTRGVRENYRYAMQCELEFFSDAMRQSA